MNKIILIKLEELHKQFKNDSSKNKFQISAIKKAIYHIKNHPNELKSKEDALKIKGIGSKISIRIEEIINTNDLKELN